ncbi:MAG: head maturation protease, ClpP-related, partial [Pseudomonadota bacterium]
MPHEIRLYGPIGGMFGYTAEEILDQIPEGAKDITVRIHSPGGSVGEGLAIYHALRDHPARVVTIVDGYAASSASFVMLAGDERLVHRNSLVYVHNPWTQAEGNADELRRVADGLDVHAEAILDIYKSRTGMGEDDLRDMMDETAFFRGEAALDKGFATAVVDNPEAEAQIAAMLKFDGMAAEAKEIEMSRQKTRREIEAEMEAQAARIVELEAQVAAATAGASADIAAAQAALGDAQAVAEGVRVEFSALQDANAELQANIAALTERADAAEADRTAALEQVQALQAQLANPAHVDAQLQTADQIVQAELDAEADDAEAKARAAESAQAEAEKPTYDKWQAIVDPRDKRAYYVANKAAILASIA